MNQLEEFPKEEYLQYVEAMELLKNKYRLFKIADITRHLTKANNQYEYLFTASSYKCGPRRQLGTSSRREIWGEQAKEQRLTKS
ncbi:hypothetical protein CDAR_599981 [Caerostris darwini]|uniref:Uncharacterized protein n=1 Tax=Caerostris darwini TaxID=1538125 RepID=A0AAV4RME4_9ARAC|nr:hypothetical protein CDAR_599981 [Caerostris darwini]